MSSTPGKRVLVTGAGGQLGRELAAIDLPRTDVVALDHRQCDIENRDQVAQTFKEFRPHAVINAAAYTAVDKAESDPERAFRTNAEGVRNVAEEARAMRARLVHVSTDYVFDGTSLSPYLPDATPNPLGVYGSSKLKGERIFAAIGVDGAIVRTAWLYSANGENFLTTILDRIRSGGDLHIVCDQIGTPTSASELAPVLLRCALDPNMNGVFHWTNAGGGSWYDFAMAIQELGLERSLIRKAVQITPIRTKDYPTAARRPAYSVLDSSLLWSSCGEPNNWRDALANVLDRWAASVHRDANKTIS